MNADTKPITNTSIFCPVCRFRVTVFSSRLLEYFFNAADVLPKVDCPGCGSDIPVEDWKLLEA